MKAIHYLERIERIHKLVSQECTGNPIEFARRLGISRTRLYEILDDLKLEGAPIVYSKSCRTFYYKEPFNISVSLEFKPLDPTNSRRVNGGIFLEGTFFPDFAAVSSYSKLTSC